jgi:hypothetical protein
MVNYTQLAQLALSQTGADKLPEKMVARYGAKLGLYLVFATISIFSVFFLFLSAYQLFTMLFNPYVASLLTGLVGLMVTVIGLAIMHLAENFKSRAKKRRVDRTVKELNQSMLDLSSNVQSVVNDIAKPLVNHPKAGIAAAALMGMVAARRL